LHYIILKSGWSCEHSKCV